MSDLTQRLAGLSPAQRQLLERRLAQPAATEPIAIVGMACRFPGAPNLDAYWRLIHDGINAAREIPPDRWNVDDFYDPTGESAGKMSVRWAALIDAPDEFDPLFFGITPREATRMDPQQRLLLEVAWEAMENAGLPADQMAGSRTAVYVGIGGTDYSKVAVPYTDYFQQIDAHMGTGNALSIAANRLSYIFDFHGPSAAVDTACSSSSLAIHFAVESLRRGEADAALAGGVNMILTPETTIAFSKARMLSPEGQCRPFDAAANGYVRGEGCGLVLLKRLSDAQRDDDQILAIIRATSVNQDGRTSGISAPNSQSQIACIRAAMRQAGLTPNEIGYVEAHGTGTPLGDPIEMQALGEIFRLSEQGTGSREQGSSPPRSLLPAPCYVSSVKANVGHMETVSGVAGLIKVVLMMQHDQIAPQTHFESLNPHIKLDGTRLVIPTEHVAWPQGGQPRIAGVSSFGFGGTNTHLIVEAAAPAAPIASSLQDDRPLHVLKLSGRTETAVGRQAEQLANFFEEHPQAQLAEVCYSANTARADFSYRATVTAADTEELRDRLANLSAAGKTGSGENAPAVGVKRGVVRTLGRPKVAMLFTGQGSQHVGMGRELYDQHPTFRQAIDACDAVLRNRWSGKSLVSILYPESSRADDPAAIVHQTEYTQPALFALEYALAELWHSWGVVPDVVLGHSVGEYAAACVAGVMGFEDGLELIAERARLMQGVRRRGRMCVVFAPESQVAEAISTSAGEVVIAVLNGPQNTVISGDAAAVDALARRFESDGIQVSILNVSHAFHSPLMGEMLDEFEQFAASIEFQAPQIPLAANLTGQLMTDAPTARYWRDHLRNTVRFADGMARVAEAEPAILIEVGPAASLLGMGRRCVPKIEAAWLPSLRQGQNGWQVIAGSVADYYVRGGTIDWRGWDQPWPRHRLLLPNYPFERTRHWFTLDPAMRRAMDDGGAGAATGTASGHPLLGARLSTVWSNALFESVIGARSPGYLIDHQVQGSPVAPAAAHVELGLAAAAQAFGEGRHGLANLVIQQAMFLPEGVRRRLQLSASPESGGEAAFEIHSRLSGDDSIDSGWTMHAVGALLHESRCVPPEEVGALGEVVNGIDLDAVRARAVSVTSHEEFYDLMRERGLAYGPSFQVLGDLHRGGDDAAIRVVLPESVIREADRYRLHPVVGDALLQSMASIVPLERDGTYSPHTYMPVGIRRVSILSTIDDYSQPMSIYAVRTSHESGPSPELVEGNVLLVDEACKALVLMEGVQVQRLGRSGTANDEIDTNQWLYRVAWKPMPVDEPAKSTATTSGTWLIFGDRQGVGRQLVEALGDRGQASVLVEAGSQYEFRGGESNNGRPNRPPTAQVDPLNQSHYERLIAEAYLSRNRPCLGIVHLWSLDVPSPSGSTDAWDTARRLGCGSLVQLLRVLARTSLPGAPPSLRLVTSGSQWVDVATNEVAAPPAVEQSSLLGLGRVAALELPELRTQLLDLDRLDDTQPAATAAALVARELAADSGEGEVAYRSGVRYVVRLARDPQLLGESASTMVTSLTLPDGRPFQLRITQAGSFDTLRFQPVDREPPQPGQVEIEVRATGLNFSDVLKALGLYPGIKDAIVPLGIEAAGIVTAVGDGVTRFEIGDEVFGVVPYAFASHARTAEYALVPKPAAIDFDEACTIPITFLTAYYGLVRLAALEPGERVLIHAGAGGVGLAAIQIAQHIGAEVFATAGSDSKREFLRALGVRHVYNSRNVDFAEEILADTNREGVDVVLNSLPGEAITKSLSILRAYGRFLEIGKTDIYQNRMIGLLPFQDNLSYFAIDLDRLLRQRPEYVRGLFAEVMDQFAAGYYTPLMFTRFEAMGTIDAFRYMSQRKNIGKVVVAIETQESSVESQEPENLGDRPSAREANQPIIRQDGTYLITGGLGALGLRMAKWLVEQGAGTIALMSRRAPSAEVEQQLGALRDRGGQVVTVRGDVADLESLRAALAQLPADAPPLRGVIHAAGILADGVLADMTLEQLDRAMLPKVQGGWNLHTAMHDAPLDFFVLFSSVAAVLGSPGQANYAAGNASLDALAQFRRASGLCATSINWGPWADAGMAAEQGREDAVQSRGMHLIPPDRGLELLGKLLHVDVVQAAVMDVHWADMLRMLGSRRPTLLEDLAAEVAAARGEESGGRVDVEFRNRLRAADGEARQAMVCNYIQQELARIMGVAAESLEIDQPLSTFGLDSLLALELKNNLEGRLDFTLPMAKLMEGPSIASLAAATVELVVGESRATLTSEMGGSDGWQPLVALRSTGTRPPLLLAPALGGDVRCYDDLTRELGGDQPVYAFRPRGIDQDLPPHYTMAAMIEDYALALRHLQPEGPYYLAGWSTGGIYAFALAEALEDAGEEVALIALFGAPVPSICDDVDIDDDARFLCDLVNFANCFTGTEMRVDYDELLKLASADRFQAALAEARQQGTVPASTPEAHIRRLVNVGEANVRAIQSFDARPLSATVHLFIPTEHGGLTEISGRSWDESGDHGWGSEIGQALELHEVPGDHFTMMLGDGAKEIARRLEALLTIQNVIP